MHRYSAFAAILCLSQPTLAAWTEEQATQSPPARLEAPSQSVTVTATRTPTELRQLGRSVTVWTRDDLLGSGARTIGEVLEHMPGISVAPAGSFGGPVSVFVRGGESDFNLVLVDGVPVNRPGGEFDFANLSTANIERVEIVRGPGSVLYGTEAVSSTIHIITRRHRSGARPSGNLRFEGGSFGTRLFDGGLNGGTDRAQFSIGALRTATDGIFDFNSAWRRTELSAGSSFLLGSRSTLSASLRLTDANQHFPTDDTGAIVDPNDFRKSREQVYSLAFQNRYSTRWNSRIHYGYHRHDALNYTLRDDITDFYDDVFQADDDRHYVDWQNSLLVVPGHELTTGVSWKREESRTAGETRRSVGVYLQDRWSWQDRYFLTGGLRIDHNDRFASFLTGNLDGAWLLNDRLKLRAGIANGFRAPAFSEIVGFPAFGITGNPALDPEKNTAVEFGADWLRSEHSRWSATVFFNRYRDLIEFTFADAPGVPNFRNVEAAASRGLELEMSHPLGDRLQAGSTYTWLSTEVTDAGDNPFGNFELGRTLLRRPRHLANFWTRFAAGWGRARLDLRYKGRRDDRQFFPDYTSRRVTLEGYWRLDLTITVPLAEWSGQAQALDLVFRGRNLLNRNYTEVAGFPSPGRGLYGGLEWGF